MLNDTREDSVFGIGMKKSVVGAVVDYTTRMKAFHRV